MLFQSLFPLENEDVSQIEQEVARERYIAQLPEKVQALAEQFAQLEQRVSALEEENRILRAKLSESSDSKLVPDSESHMRVVFSLNDAEIDLQKPILGEHLIANSEFSWTLADGVLTIYGRGKMPFIPLFNEWHLEAPQINKVVVQEGITSINVNVFTACINLTEVELPSSLTTLGGNIFALCKSLTKIELPEGIQTIPFSAFECCNNLREITIPGSVTSIERKAFGDCDELTTVRYRGTRAQWNAIEIDEGNELLEKARLFIMPNATESGSLRRI